MGADEFNCTTKKEMVTMWLLAAGLFMVPVSIYVLIRFFLHGG